MALIGDIREVDVPSLIDLARQGAGTNRLRINNNSRTITLYVTDGEIVHATLGEGDTGGVHGVYAALECASGAFELEKGVPPPTRRTIDIPWNTLLLQTLQHIDEHRNHAQTTANQEETHTMATKEKPEDIIKEMANDMEPGLRGIGIVGTDGLGIAFHKVSGETAESLGSQMALIMQLSRRSADRVEKSDLEDVLVTTDKSYLLGRMLGEGTYFLVVNVDRDSVLGNVRLAMRNYADRIVKAIPGAK